MQSKTKTAGGRIERGSANQRHLARAIDGADGAHVVASLGTTRRGKVLVGVTEISGLQAVRDAVDEYGGEIEMLGNYSETGHGEIDVYFNE